MNRPKSRDGGAREAARSSETGLARLRAQAAHIVHVPKNRDDWAWRGRQQAVASESARAWKALLRGLGSLWL